MRLGMGGLELFDGKKGMRFVSDGNGNGMGVKLMKWEEFGTKILFPHISKLQTALRKV